MSNKLRVMLKRIDIDTNEFIDSPSKRRHVEDGNSPRSSRSKCGKENENSSPKISRNLLETRKPLTPTSKNVATSTRRKLNADEIDKYLFGDDLSESIGSSLRKNNLENKKKVTDLEKKVDHSENYSTPKKTPKKSKTSKSTSKKKHPCKVCHRAFMTVEQLRSHETEHDPDHLTDEDYHSDDPYDKPSRKKLQRKTRPKTTSKQAKRVKSLLNSPIIIDRNVPLAQPQTPLEKARIRLHVSAVPESLPCRENEFAQIFSFVEGKLLDETGGCMYVSGVPGTGKTATVREVVKLLKESQMEGSLPLFKYIELNAMKLTEPHQLWVQLWKELTGQKVTADHATSLLQSRFSTRSAKREPTLLLVDELDLLWTRKQDVMYNLFDWPAKSGSKLIVVAIANTMDLPERIMMNRVSSRLGLTRMSFQPYTHQQLKTIIMSRLKGIEGFDSDAIELVARKVANLSGDARRALDISRRATEIAETNTVPLTPSKSPVKNKMLVRVLHVHKALEEVFSSPKIVAIRSCSLYQKYLLEAIIAEFLRSGLEEAILFRVLEHFNTICRSNGYSDLPSSTEVMAMLIHLSAQRIILTEQNRNDLSMRVRLNISTDDIRFALKV